MRLSNKAMLAPDELNRRLAQVKLLLTDVDGVMTDGAVYIGEQGEMKRFDIQDGLGLHMLQRCGIRVGWISKRPSPVTQRRARELKIDFVSQDHGGKVPAARTILASTGLRFDQVCYVGDDLVDLALLRAVGAAVAVPNAVSEVKVVAHYITHSAGGKGAIRELADLILKAQNKWTTVVESYESES